MPLVGIFKKNTTPLYLGFLNLDIVDMLGQIILCCGGLSCIFSSIPGPYLLEASHILAPLPSCNNQRCLQKLTNVPDGGGRRGQHLPRLRATALSQRWYLPERGKREVVWERNQMSFLSIKVLTHHWEQKLPEGKIKAPGQPRNDRPAWDGQEQTVLGETTERKRWRPKNGEASLACGTRSCQARAPQAPIPRKVFSLRFSLWKEHVNAVTSVRVEASYHFECADMTLRLNILEHGNRKRGQTQSLPLS